MHTLRRTASWIATAMAWSCGGTVTGVDRTPANTVASIDITPSAFTLILGNEAPLQATVHDESGRTLSSVPVVWSVKDTTIARVSSTGMVTARGVGSTQVAASANGISAIAALTVQRPPVVSVLVQPLTQALILGQSAAFTATPRDANGATLTDRVVTWASSNDGVATVSQAGEVTTRAAGTATITATSEGVNGSATVTVSPVPVASMAVTPTSTTITVGSTVTLSAEAKDASGNTLDRAVVWSSDNAAVASVSSAGVVTAIAAGSATVTAQSDGKSASATINVTRVPVASVAIAPTTASVAVGGAVTLVATVKDGGGSVLTDRTVGWTSSDVAVATVSATGEVSGIAPGSATITATSEGVAATAAVTIVRPAIASVVVSPTSVSVEVGKSTTFSATVRDVNGAVVTDRPVTWISSNTSVATVTPAGVVTASAVGSATISASAGGKSGSGSLTVTAVPVGSVAVSPASVTLKPTETTTLVASVKDASGNALTDRAITWTSSNPAVAAISLTGVVTAIATGSTTITATSEGKSGTAAITVTAAPVSTVVVDPTTVTLVRGETARLTATLKDASGTVLTDRVVTWTSSDNTIAVVSTSGVITGIAPGSAIVTATSEGKSATSAVTVVSPPIANVAVQPASDTVQLGGSTTYTATVTDAVGAVVPDAVVTWSSSNTAVATVSASGVVTGNKVGTATISATSGGKTGSATVTVVPIPVGSVAVTPSTATLVPTQSLSLTATVRDANGSVVSDRVVTWTSSNVAVATVSAGGVVTAVAPGSATVTATSEGKTGSASITVVPMPVGSVTVSPPTASITTGQTFALAAAVRDTSGAVVTDRVVTWSSSDATIATVSSAGVVTAVNAGTATITATSEGISGSAVVTVTPVPVASVTLEPGSVTLTPGQTATLVATTRSADGTVLTGRVVTFTSDNTGVALVSSSGAVTGVAPGSATITATSEGQTATATVTVQPAVAYVVVSPDVVFLKRGGTLLLTATAYDADNNVIAGRTITWDSSDDHIATVSTTGLLTAKKSGTVTVSATIDGKTGTTKVTVTS